MHCLLQMATLDKAEALLEDLRSASWDAAVKDLDDIKDFAAKQVSLQAHPLLSSKSHNVFTRENLTCTPTSAFPHQTKIAAWSLTSLQLSCLHRQPATNKSGRFA